MSAAGSWQGASPRTAKAIRWRVLPLVVVVAVCGFGLQGCSYFDDPDIKKVVSKAWKLSELKHTKKKVDIEWNAIRKDCTGKALFETLKRITTLFRAEVEAAYDAQPLALPADRRKQTLDWIFPEDPATFFTTERATGILLKDRVYCNTLYYFPSLKNKEQDFMMLDEVQYQAAHITQFMSANRVSWERAQKNATLFQVLKKRYRMEDLEDNIFYTLRSAIVPLEEDYYKDILFSIEAFARGMPETRGCIREFFEEYMAGQPCFWDVPGNPMHTAIATTDKDAARLEATAGNTKKEIVEINAQGEGTKIEALIEAPHDSGGKLAAKAVPSGEASRGPGGGGLKEAVEKEVNEEVVRRSG